MEDYDILDSNFGEDQKGIPFSLTSENRFILFDVLSFGLYPIWWMYHIWKFYKEKENLDVMPVARAIFSIFFIYSMSERTRKYANSKGYTGSLNSSMVLIGLIVFTVLTKLPDPLWLITTLSFFVYLPILKAFNFAIENDADYDEEYKTGFSPLQIGMMILGIIFWILVLIGLFVPLE